MQVLVTGGTGHLGRDFVQAALAAGHHVRIASRKPAPAQPTGAMSWAQLDFATGHGMREAVTGVEVVVHAASDPKNKNADAEGTRRLLEEARAAGVGHFIFISIVGIDRIPVPYYRLKLAIERTVADSGVPYSILRATQFHYFVDMLLGALARVPLVLPLPAGFHIQSVATEDVAARLMRAVVEGPGGMLRDYAGPEAMTLADAANAWKKARGLTKPTLAVPVPGRAGAALRAGYNTAPDGKLGTITWADWLNRNYSR